MPQDIQQVPKELYYNDQLLSVEDFEREQNYHLAQRELQTRLCYTAGVLSGLTVGSVLPSRIVVSPGVAIDGMGRQVVLAAGARFGETVVELQAGEVVLDLDKHEPACISGIWHLVIEADPIRPETGSLWIEYPKLSLLPSKTKPSEKQIALAQLTLTTTETTDKSSGQPFRAIEVRIDQKPPVPAMLSPERVPEVSADKITTGKLGSGVTLCANQITSGFLSAERLPPGIGSDESLAGLRAVWAVDVAVSARGLRVEAVSAASSKQGFVIGLLRARVSTGAMYYALAIGFREKLVSFTRTTANLTQTNADLAVNVYPERTAYDLYRESGLAGQTITDVQFVGLDPEDCFNLLLPDTKIPQVSQGRIRSLVTIGTTLLSGDSTPGSAVTRASDVIHLIRNAISPFGFVAMVAPAPPVATPDDVARQLAATNIIAPDAAAILAAQQPQSYVGADGVRRMMDLTMKYFPDSTKQAVQMAWTLASAAISAKDAAAGITSRYSWAPKEVLVLLSGSYPAPSVVQTIAQLQEEGKSAADAAASIKQSAPAQFYADPVQLGITLRLNFSETAEAPDSMAQALMNAGYAKQPEVVKALQLLFPKSSSEELTPIVSQIYGGGSPAPKHKTAPKKDSRARK